MYKHIFIFLVFFWCSGASEITGNDIIRTQDSTFEECLKRDSISCVQVHIFRSMKSFFDQDSVDLIGGISIVREKDNNYQAKARTSEDVIAEEQILETTDIEQRENALESFVFQKMIAFFQERSVRWSLSPVFSEMTATARGLVENLPEDFRQKVTDLVTEARGKKKLLKTLLPILIGVKLKAVAFIALTYLGIALIAKKSLLLSFISLALSGFVSLRKLLSKKSAHHSHHDAHESYPSHGGGWGGSSSPVVGVGYSSGGYGGGYDSTGYGQAEYGSHSSPVAHTLAYGGQKAARR